MKKSLLALAVLGSFAGGALAQSSVTLFGIVDLNARYVKNDGSKAVKSLSQDGIASSRIGFRGVEDLGGGLKAGFWLEGAINPDTGTPGGQTWQRRSTVSLMGGFGEVRLGRDYTPTFWNHTVFDPFGTNGLGSQTNLQGTAGSGATTLVRANNTIGYFLPALGGVYGQLQVAAGEGIGANKYMGGRVGYQGGPVNVAVAYGETEVTPATSLKAANIGASYDLGVVKLFGQYHQYKFGAAKAKNALIGLTAPVGPGTVKAAFSNVSGSGAAVGKASQLAVGYQYDLSKRTALYTNVSYIKNKAGQTTTYNLPGGGPLTGLKSKGAEFGVRHTF